MSGNTPELSLKTAVDADDTADYLTIALASSLTTVDSLFNNTTGHSHNGAHQGGPITSIPAGAIPDGSITSAKIADGTIATADLANASVTNAKLASDTARLNLLSNPGFEISQRGAGPFTTHLSYTLDRWQMSVTGPSTASITQITSTVGSVGKSLQTVYTHSAAGLSEIFQLLDGPQMYGKTFTLAVTVKSNVAGTVKVGLVDFGGAAGTRVYSAYNSTTNAAERLTATFTMPSSGSGGLFAIIRTDVASATVEVNDATLVVGSQAADYAPLHPADDLARCLRYYETIGTPATGDFGGSGLVTAGGTLRAWAQFKAWKPTTPTVTRVGTWLVANCGQPTVSNIGSYGCMLSSTGTNANTDTYYLTQAAGAYLTVESNP